LRLNPHQQLAWRLVEVLLLRRLLLLLKALHVSLLLEGDNMLPGHSFCCCCCCCLVCYLTASQLQLAPVLVVCLLTLGMPAWHAGWLGCCVQCSPDQAGASQQVC
jgi:hypothetical protein